MAKGTVRLTMAQALVRALASQWTEIDGERVRLFAGVWAIFGHGNVSGVGEALYAMRGALPTLRAHNEQAMAHAAIAFAKASRRRRLMACTTSIGPGATNLVTAAALAHVNRLPVLLLPGDVFASRRPDPVLQQLEDFSDGTVTANDCLRPVSRYFDRLTRPEQLGPALARGLNVLMDPADCGPVTLALCQDVQAEAFDYHPSLFEEHVWRVRRPRPDEADLAEAVSLLRNARRPLVVAGGGVLYSGAEQTLKAFCESRGLPSCETQAGKSALPWEHPLNLGAVGVTGTAAANSLAAEADLIVALGTRLQDFTTGSGTLFRRHPSCRVLALNVQPFDAAKHGAHALTTDARVGIELLDRDLGDWRSDVGWTMRAKDARTRWFTEVTREVGTPDERPSDAEVIAAVQRMAAPEDVIVGAAGGLPGELHKLWRALQPVGYHMEYGYSCMGYEIAGGLGVKLARPHGEVIVMVGDGSYLMMNSEIATSVTMDRKLIVVLLDNGGYGCINRLQTATGGASFNNLIDHTAAGQHPGIDFVAHARSLGAAAEKAASIGELEISLKQARRSDRTFVVVIQTDPTAVTAGGGHWWDVVVPEVSERAEVRAARASYEAALSKRRTQE
ncbi:MAG: 3D-(3,5/4)-trihydroxycyclohexane-1,2-dione acylhydrolase (decyclizing) [Steroidobacteraceae bacterium]